MTIEEARKILGKDSSKYRDDEVEEVLGTLTVLADIAIDQWIALSPEEKEAWRKKTKNKDKKAT